MSSSGRLLLLTSLLVVVFSLVSSARAGTWTETGDAGHLIPQTTAGTGALTAIVGDHAGFDPVDLYCIKIVDPLVFQASVSCVAINEYDLILFDANFNGVALTDNCAFSVVLLTGTLVTSSGTYYLGHSSPDSSPFSTSGIMWVSQLALQDRAPDGAGAANPLISWALGNESGTAYTINLAGCEFCEPPLPTETGPWGRIKALYQ